LYALAWSPKRGFSVVLTAVRVSAIRLGRKPKASAYLVQSSAVREMHPALAKARAEIPRSANRFDAFRGRAPSFAHHVLFLMSERRSISVESLPSQLWSCHRRMMQRRTASHLRIHRRRHRRRLVPWRQLCPFTCRALASTCYDNMQITDDELHPRPFQSHPLLARPANVLRPRASVYR